MLKASSTYNLLPRKISGEPKNAGVEMVNLLIVSALRLRGGDAADLCVKSKYNGLLKDLAGP